MSDFFDSDGQAGALKAGFLGFGGSGKTYTAILLACAVREVLGQQGPVAMFDTESGSIYVEPVVVELTGQKLLKKRARDLQTLMEFGRQCQLHGAAAAVVDSITHPWRELCDSYLAQVNQARARRQQAPLSKLEFHHWGPIKAQWQRWTDFYINSPLSILICGRAGFEFDNEVNDDTGRKELVKTGIKMKTEGEMGYEPSLLVLMEAEQDMERNKDAPAIHRTATVLKDRFRALDGRDFEFRGLGSVRKDYEQVKRFFAPHLEMLHAGAHSTVDTSGRTHFDISADGQDAAQREMREREILRDEIQHLLIGKWGSQSGSDKKARTDMIADLFGRPSWTYVETLNSDVLRKGRDELARRLAGSDAAAPPVAEPEPAEAEKLVELTPEALYDKATTLFQRLAQLRPDEARSIWSQALSMRERAERLESAIQQTQGEAQAAW